MLYRLVSTVGMTIRYGALYNKQNNVISAFL